VAIESVKDPAYPDTRYVVDLVAPSMVNTMPEATLRRVADRGQVPADSVHGHYDQSREALDQLRELGIDYDDVVQALEDDGVAKFDASWDQLGERLASTLRSQSAGL
jgi:transaldolase